METCGNGARIGGIQITRALPQMEALGSFPHMITGYSGEVPGAVPQRRPDLLQEIEYIQIPKVHLLVYVWL